MISESDYDGLVADLYGGLTEPERLHRFMKGLGDATGCHAGGFLRQDLADISMTTQYTLGASSEEVVRLTAEHGADNLWIERSLAETRTGSVLFGEDRVTLRELQRTRYYEGLLRQLDIGYSVGICCQLQPRHITYLTFCRPERSGPFDADNRALYERFAPHFVNAYALLTQMEQLRAQTAHGEGRIRAMFLLDRQLHWLGGNQAADAMVASGGWRSGKGKPLIAAHPQTQQAWMAAQRKAQTSAGTAAFPVLDRSGRLAAFAALHSYGAASLEDQPSYILFVRALQAVDPNLMASQLREVFGLTRAEAALVLALSEGHELNAAASVLGITMNTARSRLQAIFEKTGTHRQVELLQLVNAMGDVIG